MLLYCTSSTWCCWYTYTCIVPDIHDDVPVLHQIYMINHHHVYLVQYRYMCTIIMYIWYNTGTCVSSSSCRSGTIHAMMVHMHLHYTRSTWRWWYTCILLYQIYMMMMVHMHLYYTRSTWGWWYTSILMHVNHHHVDLVQYRYMCTTIM
jgi:hypothetical protein